MEALVLMDLVGNDFARFVTEFRPSDRGFLEQAVERKALTGNATYVRFGRSSSGERVLMALGEASTSAKLLYLYYRNTRCMSDLVE